MITWNTDVNAPGCPGEIVGPNGRSILIQTDWDYPRTASTFGWSLRNVQRCPCCKTTKVETDPETFGYPGCTHLADDKCRVSTFKHCDHDGTDGTVDCKECGVTVSEFISAAYDWLRDNDGVTAEDPGYFTE